MTTEEIEFRIKFLEENLKALVIQLRVEDREHYCCNRTAENAADDIEAIVEHK